VKHIVYGSGDTWICRRPIDFLLSSHFSNNEEQKLGKEQNREEKERGEMAISTPLKHGSNISNSQ